MSEKNLFLTLENFRSDWSIISHSFYKYSGKAGEQ